MKTQTIGFDSETNDQLTEKIKEQLGHIQTAIVEAERRLLAIVPFVGASLVFEAEDGAPVETMRFDKWSGQWRLLYTNDSEIGWTPVVDTPIETRIRCLEHVSDMYHAIKKRKRMLLDELNSTTSRLEQFIGLKVSDLVG